MKSSFSLTQGARKKSALLIEILPYFCDGQNIGTARHFYNKKIVQLEKINSLINVTMSFHLCIHLFISEN